MQDDNKKVNRPVGWKFYNIVGGEIRYMKLWQVSVGAVPPALQVDSISVSPSP